MLPFDVVDAVAVPFDQPNVDTDQLLPARFLRKPRSDDFGAYLFRDLRFGADGAERAEFILNEPAYRGAQIAVAAKNFGCGSSREHAVWALADYGFRALVAPSFGDIFYNNSFQNGFLPIVVDEERAAAWRRALHESPGARMRVDLPAQTIAGPDGTAVPFAIAPFRKQCLLAGVDDIGFTLRHQAQIAAFERERARTHGWL